MGPAAVPVVLQPKVMKFNPVDGAAQVTVRPVEPRNGPFVTVTNVKIVEFQLRVKV